MLKVKLESFVVGLPHPLLGSLTLLFADGLLLRLRLQTNGGNRGHEVLEVDSIDGYFFFSKTLYDALPT